MGVNSLNPKVFHILFFWSVCCQSCVEQCSQRFTGTTIVHSHRLTEEGMIGIYYSEKVKN